MAGGVISISLGLLVPTVGAASGPPVAPATVASRATYDAEPAPAAEPAPPAETDSLAPGTTGVLVDLHGTVSYARVRGASVGSALSELGWTSGQSDRVTPDLEAVLAEGLRVTIRTLTTSIRKNPVVLPRPTRQVADPGLDIGATGVESEGADGLGEVATEVTYEDGAAVGSRVVEETVVQAPAERVIRVGTRPPAPPPLPADGGYSYTLAMASHNVTAYCLTGRTATGTLAGPGSIAVDPSVIKLGSHLYVPGYGYGWAVDTGGGIHGDAIDLWMTCDDAIRWGRRSVTIFVLDH